MWIQRYATLCKLRKIVRYRKAVSQTFSFRGGGMGVKAAGQDALTVDMLASCLLYFGLGNV